MKPSLTPCRFSNSSLYSLRIAITALMSTSLNVVSIAAVFCASFSRRAMVWRSRVMRTRSSRDSSSSATGARICWTGTGAAPWRRQWRAGLDPCAQLRLAPLRHLPSAPVRAGRCQRPRRHRRPFPRESCAPPAMAACSPSAQVQLGAAAAAAWRGCRHRAGPLPAAPARPRCRPLSFGDRRRAPRRLRPYRLLHGNAGEHAGGRRRHFDRHLVGFELTQRLVDRDRFTGLLEPLPDRRLGDGFAQRRNPDFSRHVIRCPVLAGLQPARHAPTRVRRVAAPEASPSPSLSPSALRRPAPSVLADAATASPSPSTPPPAAQHSAAGSCFASI